jgi:Fe-Mn family superoxide dismutase
MKGLSRRTLLAGAGSAAVLGTLPKPLWGQVAPANRPLQIPELPLKVFSTERVGISRKTHEEHLKLWQGYAKKTNELRAAIASLDTDPAKANQIYSATRSLKVDYSFAYEGYINHEIYFDTLGGTGGPATGRIADLIRASYGTYEKWASDFKATALAGRGWAFLARDRRDGTVFNYIGDSQNTFPIWNHDCVLALDVYEHAYYLDFQTARAKYVDAWFQTIDWDSVNRRLG